MNHWSTRAACKGVDPDIFFPDIHNNSVNIAAYVDAAAVCASCTVRAECLTDTLEAEGGAVLRYGYYGGATPRQRRKLASSAPRMCARCDEAPVWKPRARYCLGCRTAARSDVNAKYDGVRRFARADARVGGAA